MTACGTSSRSSDAVNSRPMAGLTPSTSKNPPDTSRPRPSSQPSPWKRICQRAEVALTGHHRREPIGLIAQLPELFVGHPRPRAVGAPVPAAGPTAGLVGVGQHHQLARLRHHRQRRMQHAVPQLEDGGIGADAQGQRQQRRRGESRPGGHRAQRVAQVLPAGRARAPPGRPSSHRRPRAPTGPPGHAGLRVDPRDRSCSSNISCICLPYS